jgi:hypothetical protein
VSVLQSELDREAGIITLLLDERPTLAFTLGPAAGVAMPFLMVEAESLGGRQTASGVCPGETGVTKADGVEGVGVLVLQGRDLGLEGLLVFFELVIPLDVPHKSPVVEIQGLSNEGVVGWGGRGDDSDEPWREDVGDPIRTTEGEGEEVVSMYECVGSSDCSQRKGRANEALNVRGLNLFTPFDTNEEIREATVIRLVALRGVRVGGIKDRGGVVACAYVGKLLVEVVDLFLPVASQLALLVSDGLEGGLEKLLLSLETLHPFDPCLGCLLTQEGSVLVFEVEPMGVELQVPTAWGDGLIVVLQHVDEGVIESRAYVKGGWGRGVRGIGR